MLAMLAMLTGALGSFRFDPSSAMLDGSLKVSEVSEGKRVVSFGRAGVSSTIKGCVGSVRVGIPRRAVSVFVIKEHTVVMREMTLGDCKRLSIPVST